MSHPTDIAADRRGGVSPPKVRETRTLRWSAEQSAQSCLLGQLVGEHVDPMDLRRLGEELRGLRHEFGRDLALEMGPRPRSLAKASKMPKVLGPIRIANQAVVSGSASTIERAPDRKDATSCSLPGLASSWT